MPFVRRLRVVGQALYDQVSWRDALKMESFDMKQTGDLRQVADICTHAVFLCSEAVSLTTQSVHAPSSSASGAQVRLLLISPLPPQGRANDLRGITTVLMGLEHKKAQKAGGSLMERPAWLQALKCEFDKVDLLFKAGIYLQQREAAKKRDWRGNCSAQLLHMNYSSDLDPRKVSEQHLAFGKEMRRRFGKATPPRELARDLNPNRRLKIGYISPDLKSHVVSKFLQGPVREHDREQVSRSRVRALSPTHSHSRTFHNSLRLAVPPANRRNAPASFVPSVP